MELRPLSMLNCGDLREMFATVNPTARVMWQEAFDKMHKTSIIKKMLADEVEISPRTLYQAPADPESEYGQSSDENKSEYEETSSLINSQYDSDATEMDSDIEQERALKKSKAHQVRDP